LISDLGKERRVRLVRLEIAAIETVPKREPRKRNATSLRKRVGTKRKAGIRRRKIVIRRRIVNEKRRKKRRGTEKIDPKARPAKEANLLMKR